MVSALWVSKLQCPLQNSTRAPMDVTLRIMPVAAKRRRFQIMSMRYPTQRPTIHLTMSSSGSSWKATTSYGGSPSTSTCDIPLAPILIHCLLRTKMSERYGKKFHDPPRRATKISMDYPALQTVIIFPPKVGLQDMFKEQHWHCLPF